MEVVCSLGLGLCAIVAFMALFVAFGYLAAMIGFFNEEFKDESDKEA